MIDEIESDWNFAVCYLEFLFNEQVLATGSGFFWKSISGQTFLVSNWHNFSGRSNEDGQPLSKNGGIPNSVSFYAYQQTSVPDENNQFTLNITKTTIPLIHEQSDENLWYEHSHFGRKVDIAAINVDLLPKFSPVVSRVLHGYSSA